MDALNRLSAKIDALKEAYERLKSVNENLKEQIADAASALEKNKELELALEASKKREEAYQTQLHALKEELSLKDQEIEKIIMQVEALLSEQ